MGAGTALQRHFSLDALNDGGWGALRHSFKQPDRIDDAGRQAGAWKRPLHLLVCSLQLFALLGFAFRAQDASGPRGSSGCIRSSGAGGPGLTPHKGLGGWPRSDYPQMSGWPRSRF
jgi:hypothetical protein